MIVCDRALMQSLRKEAHDLRRNLDPAVAAAIDEHITLADSNGEPWYSTKVVSRAFGVRLNNRTVSNTHSFQGHLRKAAPSLKYATLLLAVLTNKATRGYLPWKTFEDAEEALKLSSPD